MDVSSKRASLQLFVVLAVVGLVTSNILPPTQTSSHRYQRDNPLALSITQEILSPETCYNGSDGIANECKWPGGVFVYEIDDVFSSHQLNLIRQVHRQITEATKSCITFRRRAADDRTYVMISKIQRCIVQLGRRDGVQEMSAADECFTGNSETHMVTVMHLLSLGLWFEHGRQDRDDYITVLEENADEDALPLLQKLNGTTYGTPYDYGSLLHVDEYFFSKNFHPVIIPHDPYAVIGRAGYMSKLDAVKLRTMYGCN